MTSTTGGNLFGYEPDDMPTRSIPVGELLRREGHASVARAFDRRRGVLTGVAAGAVLAIGAAVGSLVIGHSDSGANALASGASGAGALVPEDGAGAIAASTGGSSAQAGPQQQQVTPNVAPMAQVTPRAATPRAPQANHQPVRTGAAPGAPTAATSTTRSAQPSTSTPPSASSPGTGTTSAPPSTSSSSSPSSSSTPSTPPSTTTPPSSGSGNDGGLLGTVGGVLGGVTQPVFNWFGG